MKSIFKPLVPLAGIVFLAASPGGSQDAITPSPEIPLPQLKPQIERKRMQQIRLGNVKPSVMAWWLDPQNNPQPAGATSETRIHDLPEGIDRIVAIDPQMALLVFGTAEAVRELRDTVQFLDRPQRQTEIQIRNQIQIRATLHTVASDKLEGVWARLAAENPPIGPALTFVQSTDVLQLSTQIGRGEAKRIATRILTLEGDTPQWIDFGPSSPPPADQPAYARDFSSAMPVIPPPESGYIRNGWSNPTGFRAPAPFDALRVRISALNLAGDSLMLRTDAWEFGGGLKIPQSAGAQFSQQKTLAFALPASPPDTRAFLLINATKLPVFAPVKPKIPQLRDIPNIGGLFRAPTPQNPAPQKTP